MKNLKLIFALAVVFVGISAHAQSGTTCCKIDLGIIAPDGNGTFTVIHGGPGGITLPSGSYTVATGLNLQEALAAAGDDLYKSKGSQQSMILRPAKDEPVVLADGPEPIPLCYPWPCKSSE